MAKIIKLGLRKTQAAVEADALKMNLEILESYSGNNKNLHKYKCLLCFWEFPTRPNDVQQKHGCPRCVGLVKTQEDCEIQAAKQNLKFKDHYSSNHKLHKYECLVCLYEFQATPGNVQQDHGCPRCAGSVKTEQEADEDATRQNLKAMSPYTTALRSRTYKCLTCSHVFPKRPNMVQQGQGCPKCNRTCTKWKNGIYAELVQTLPHLEQNAKGVLKNKKYHSDILDRQASKAVELDGPTHYQIMYFDKGSSERFDKQQTSDARKDQEYVDAGIKFIRVKYSEFKKNPKEEMNKIIRFLTF